MACTMRSRTWRARGFCWSWPPATVRASPPRSLGRPPARRPTLVRAPRPVQMVCASLALSPGCAPTRLRLLPTPRSQTCWWSPRRTSTTGLLRSQTAAGVGLGSRRLPRALRGQPRRPCHALQARHAPPPPSRFQGRCAPGRAWQRGLEHVAGRQLCVCLGHQHVHPQCVHARFLLFLLRTGARGRQRALKGMALSHQPHARAAPRSPFCPHVCCAQS